MLLDKKARRFHPSNYTLTVCLWFVALAMIGFPIACGGGKNSGDDAIVSAPQDFGRATVTIIFPKPSRLIPNAAQSITVQISQGATVVSTKSLVRPSEGGAVTASFDSLPVGDLVATASAYPNQDSSGTAQATASTPLTITKGSTTPFRITMESTIDRLVLSPADVQLPIGQTQAMTATPQNVDGATVLVNPGTLTWQSSNPAVATVSSSGVLTGVAIGTTTLTATETESGKTAAVTVNVVVTVPSPSPSPSGCSLGTAPPSFAEPITLPTRPGTSMVKVADFDSDGNNDIAVTGRNSLHMYYGRGDGTFDQPRETSSINFWFQADPADVDNDGRMDLLTYNVGTVYYHRNLGGRNFAPSINLNLGYLTQVRGIAAITIPGQSNKYLAVCLESNNAVIPSAIHVLRITGNNMLENVAQYPIPQGQQSSPSAIVAEDINRDGIQDLVVKYFDSHGSSGANGISVFKGQADGTFTPLYGIPLEPGTISQFAPHGLTATDLNNDGQPDIAFATGSNSGIGVVINQSSTPLDPVYYPTSDKTSYFRIANFDRDCFPDMVTISNPSLSFSNKITVAWNRNGSFTPISIPIDIGTNTTIGWIDTGDFNKDGKQDIVALVSFMSGNSNSQNIAILMNTTP